MYFWVLAILAIVFDQTTKYFAATSLADNNFVVIPKILDFIYVQNKGAAFGILQNGKWLFLLAIPVVCIFLIYLHLKEKNNIFLGVSFALIIGGAIGNYIDRIRVGYVIDFIDFKIWPVFNFADSCIVIGAALYIIYSFFMNKKTEVANESS
jgi:signal peptidase II